MDLVNSIGNAITGGPSCEKPAQCSSPSLVDTLRRQQLELSERLQTVTAAIAALEKNPDVARVLELVARARY